MFTLQTLHYVKSHLTRKGRKYELFLFLGTVVGLLQSRTSLCSYANLRTSPTERKSPTSLNLPLAAWVPQLWELPSHLVINIGLNVFEYHPYKLKPMLHFTNFFPL